MNVKVIKLYDIAQVTIPEELTHWQVTEEQMDAQMELLSKLAAVETSADKAEAGDCVVCACDSGALAGRTVLLYPGQNIPGAEAAEAAVLGLSVGAAFTAELNGTASLKVEKIIRRQASEVDDALIAGLGIEGVSTVAQYRDWYSQSTAVTNREQALKSIKGHIISTLAENSQFEMDEAELEPWVMGQIEEIKMAAPEMLGNPEDFDITMPLLKEQIVGNLKQEAITKAICESQGFTFTAESVADQIAATMQQIAEMPGMEMSEAECAEMLVNGAYVEKAWELMDEKAQAALEG